ncbi:MAG: DUF4381 family protein [Gemmataceae bacterium]|nr:DUF4381 family protein [Gemmataceae bacterium]
MRTLGGSVAVVVLAAASAWAGVDQPTILQCVDGVTLKSPTVPDAAGRLAIAFADVITLTLEATANDVLEVLPPERWTNSPWLVRPAGPARSSQRQWSITLLVEPMAPGEALLILEPIKVRSDGGTWRSIRWQPIPIRVTSTLDQPNAAMARDITAIETLAAPSPAEHRGSLVSLVVAGGVVGVVGAMFWLWRRRKIQHTEVPSCEVKALARLARLEARRLLSRGRHAQFATLLAALLRRYVEDKYRVPARRRTTVELLAALDQCLDPAQGRAALADLLERCDRLKFAPPGTSPDLAEELAAAARTFLTNVASAAQLAVAGPTLAPALRELSDGPSKALAEGKRFP